MRILQRTQALFLRATRAWVHAVALGTPLLAAAAPGEAASCRAITVEGAGYTLCEADAASDDIRLFLTDPESGGLLGSFANVERLLARGGARLAFAMNGGMYHPDRSPVGLHLEPGGTRAPLVTSPGPGNFGMLPNGVFCVGERTRALHAALPQSLRAGWWPDCEALELAHVASRVAPGDAVLVKASNRLFWKHGTVDALCALLTPQ